MARIKKEYKVSKDMAVDELYRWTDFMDLDVDFEDQDLTEEEEKSRKDLLRTLTTAIQKGVLVVTDNYELQHFTRCEDALTITYREPRGSTYLALDNIKEGHRNVAKMNQMLGAMCEMPAKTFATMAERDYKIAKAILTLFITA